MIPYVLASLLALPALAVVQPNDFRILRTCYDNDDCAPNNGTACFAGKCQAIGDLYNAQYHEGEPGAPCRTSRDCKYNNCWSSYTDSEGWGNCGGQYAACSSGAECWGHGGGSIDWGLGSGNVNCFEDQCRLGDAGDASRPPAPSRHDYPGPTTDGALGPDTLTPNCAVYTDCKEGQDCYNGFCVKVYTRTGAGEPGDLCHNSKDCKYNNCYNYLTQKPRKGNCGAVLATCESDSQCASAHLGNGKCQNRLCMPRNSNASVPSSSSSGSIGNLKSQGVGAAAQDATTSYSFAGSNEYAITSLAITGANLVLVLAAVILLVVMRRGGKRYFRVQPEPAAY